MQHLWEARAHHPTLTDLSQGFFNAMLQELGAKDLKVQEVFGLDEITLGTLP
jgi:hypothetical protein